MLEKIKNILIIIGSGIVTVLGVLFLVNQNKGKKLVEDTSNTENNLKKDQDKVEGTVDSIKEKIEDLEENGAVELTPEEIQDYWNEHLK